ncbi:MAG: hypothetical protein ACFFF4_06550 [Candidatus Thorarchaeota archaeon]
MSKAHVKILDNETADDWSKVYNQVMQQSLRFSPLSSSTLLKIAEYLNIHGVTFLLSYEKLRPSAICSYLVDKVKKELSILDFGVLPIANTSGAILLDHLLHLARSSGCNRVKTWLPTTSTRSLDTLAEYLFSPGRAKSVMRCFLEEPPEEFDCEISEIISNQDDDITLLPFQVPYQMQSLIESLMSPWKYAYRISSRNNQNEAIDVYLTNKHRLQAWIFQSNQSERPVNFEILSSSTAFLYDTGVRDIFTEVESGELWQLPYKDVGFDRVTTRFELYFEINY